MEILSTITSTIGSMSWVPLVNLSKRSIIMLLERIERGSLRIETQNREVFTYGPGGAPSSYLKVNSDMFWIRLLLFADMGFSEAYMLGEVDCSDLCSFFTIFIENRTQLSNINTISSTIFNSLKSIVKSTNTMSNSLLNVAAHYDISNDMFAAFLTPDMTYSCALFDSIPNDTDLEAAQYRKINKIINLAKIKSTDHLLEIGTGWGSFSIEAVKKTGCKVTTLTLSIEQKALAEKRIAAEGMADDITVLLCDYRALKTPRKKFDKVVSIEMLEAVGKEYLDTYFETINRLLKVEGGIAVFQCITMPETVRSDSYAKGNDFIRKYIFPGGYLPSHTQLVTSINKGSAGQLILESVDNIGGHYTRTLRIWCENFLKTFDDRIAPALKKQHPDMGDADVKVFKRKWEYYFMYCEAGFKAKVLNDIIFSVGREGATELYEGIPL